VCGDIPTSNSFFADAEILHWKMKPKGFGRGYNLKSPQTTQFPKNELRTIAHVNQKTKL
jgi:hypothetical protein